MKANAWIWRRAILLACAWAGCCQAPAGGRGFQHPGLLQTRDELAFMRKKVKAGEEPWKSAWDHLCAQSYSSLDFQPKPIAHIVRGSYEYPSVGDRDLSASGNGGSVPPGRGLEHNLVLNHVDGAEVRESRLDEAMCGSGLSVHACRGILVANNELARNALDGLEASDSRDIRARGNLAEANDRDGIFLGREAVGCADIEAAGNVSRNNGQAGLQVERAISGVVRDNAASDNGTKEQIEIVDSTHSSH